MHIVNIMFARGGGGIEQAFVDYCEGLHARGHQVTAFVYPDSVSHGQLKKLNIDTITMRNFGEWDMLAAWRLKRALRNLKPDATIAHANRAYSLARKAVPGDHPVIGVAQNYSTRRFSTADAVFTTTHDLIAHLTKQGIEEERIFHIPNMVRCHELPHRGSRNDPPVIGTMGRFVAKKGFHIFIDALKILVARGHRFRAVIGGTGVEAARLQDQAKSAGLNDILEFSGWVQDKRAFYSSVDIFCLPSLHEPFGIVLLEAFTNGVPVVATDSEGPRDIIAPNYDALVVEKNSASALAEALARLLTDPRLGDDLAANAFAKAKTKYSMEGVSQQIEQAVVAIVARHATWKSGRKAA